MSSISTRPTANLFQRIDKKLLIAVAGFMAAVVIGAASFASAAPGGNKPTKEWCSQQGYSNYGRCVSAWRHSNGYGGNGDGDDDHGQGHHAHKHFNWGVWGTWVSFQTWWDSHVSGAGDAWHAWRISFWD